MHAHKNVTAWLLSLVVAAPLLGCASTTTAARSTTPPAAVGECFDPSMATSFAYLQNRYVYITVVGGQHYLLTLADECVGLVGARHLAVTSSFNRVCSDTGAVLTFEDFDQQRFCRIIGVESVKDRAEAETLVGNRTTPTRGR